MNEKPKFPVIFTFYNDAIDKKVAEYQSKVIDKLTQGRIAFRPMHVPVGFDVMEHGDVLNKAIYHLFYQTRDRWDCALILDIDCVPLSFEAIEMTLITAYEGNLVGNIQRSNHLDNNKHTYVAPSYMCFTREYYEDVGSPTMNNSFKYDVGEIMTANADKFNKPVIKLMPMHSECGYDDKGSMFDLADDMPKYGIGTTFGLNDIPISYHLFGSSFGTWNEQFYKKCDSIINSSK